MPHFQNQHEDRSPKGVFLTEEQFAKLVELLTPGYEVAKLYLAEARSRAVDVPTSTPAPAPTPDP